MPALERHKTRYELLREQEVAYVEARWSSGRTVLKWTMANPEPQFKEEELHDLSHDPDTDAPWVHTPFQICRPDLPFGGKRCDKHEAELAELLSTSPPVDAVPEDEDQATYKIHDQLVDVKESTIRQEFARKGILVLTPRTYDDGDDDPMTNVEDGTPTGTAPYTAVTAEIIGLIELEKKMYRAGRVQSIVRKGPKLKMRGYEQCTVQEQRDAALDYLRACKKSSHPYNESRANAQRQMTRKLNAVGEKATIFRLYGIKEVPKEYFEVDEDPNRLVLHETDMDVHDVHAIIEPKDPDADPTLHAMSPEEFEVRFYLRGHQVPWQGEDDAFERNQTLRNFLAAKALHVGSYVSPSLTGDHELAESEWDLGIEFTEYEEVDPDWVEALLASAPASQI